MLMGLLLDVELAEKISLVENANWKYVLVNMFVKPQPLKMPTH
jgi:hypothetical protein